MAGRIGDDGHCEALNHQSGDSRATTVGFAESSPLRPLPASVDACVNGDGVGSRSPIRRPMPQRVRHYESGDVLASVIDVGPGARRSCSRWPVGWLGHRACAVQRQRRQRQLADRLRRAACAQGVLTTVTDDNGVQHEACVESAADVPSRRGARQGFSGAATHADDRPGNQRRRGCRQPASAQVDWSSPSLLVGSGSIASLLSRRKS